MSCTFCLLCFDSYIVIDADAGFGIAARKKVTIQHLKQMKQNGTPITMLTAYDYRTGKATEAYGIDITLVGDSLAQVCLGYDSTTRLTLDEMLHHTRAVSRGCQHPLLVADMPFGTYHGSTDETVRNAVRIIQEGRMEAVKLEGGLGGGVGDDSRDLA